MTFGECTYFVVGCIVGYLILPSLVVFVPKLIAEFKYAKDNWSNKNER